jgi:hypothetical protein
MFEAILVGMFLYFGWKLGATVFKWFFTNLDKIACFVMSIAFIESLGGGNIFNQIALFLLTLIVFFFTFNRNKFKEQKEKENETV